MLKQKVGIYKLNGIFNLVNKRCENIFKIITLKNVFTVFKELHLLGLLLLNLIWFC